MKGNSFGSYLKEMGRYDILTREEEQALGRNVQDMMRLHKIRQVHRIESNMPSKEWADAANLSEKELKRVLAKGKWAKDKFIKHNLRLVVSIAKKYVDRGLSLADLVQEGSIGLNRAAEKFNPQKGFKFSTYSCVPLSTKIYTRSGWKFYNEVENDDETLGYENGELKWTKIKGIKTHKNAPVVNFASSSTINPWSVKCTGQHKWLISKEGQQPTLQPLHDWKNEEDNKLTTSGIFAGYTFDIDELSATWLAEMYCGSLKKDLTKEMKKLWEESNLEHLSIDNFLLSIPPSARTAWILTYIKCMRNTERLEELYKNSQVLGFGLYISGFNQVRFFTNPESSPLLTHSIEKLSVKNSTIKFDKKEDVWCPSTELGSWTACTEDGHIFVTGNTWWIRQGITRAVAIHSRTIRLPVHIFERLNKIKKVTREISQQKRRAPTVKEIAEAIGEKEKRVLQLIDFAKTTRSLDSLIGDSKGCGSCVGDMMIDSHTASPEDLLNKELNKEYVAKLLDKSLTEQERIIIKSRYGIDAQVPAGLKDIGIQLGITTERVRQIERRALAKLKEVNKLIESQQEERLEVIRARNARRYKPNSEPQEEILSEDQLILEKLQKIEELDALKVPTDFLDSLDK